MFHQHRLWQSCQKCAMVDTNSTDDTQPMRFIAQWNWQNWLNHFGWSVNVIATWQSCQNLGLSYLPTNRWDSTRSELHFNCVQLLMQIQPKIQNRWDSSGWKTSWIATGDINSTDNIQPVPTNCEILNRYNLTGLSELVEYCQLNILYVCNSSSIESWRPILLTWFLYFQLNWWGTSRYHFVHMPCPSNFLPVQVVTILSESVTIRMTDQMKCFNWFWRICGMHQLIPF